MLDWLAKKGQNSRVYMCIKEVRWDLESRSPLNKAIVLALAQLFRHGFSDDPDFPKDIFDDPLGYSREDLLRFYEGLETIRNNAVAQRESLVKSMRQFGGALPAYSLEHMKSTNRGLEVWMCTLGAGIAPDRRDEVRTIWSMLISAVEHAPDAIRELRATAARTAEDTGGRSMDMFSIDDGVWLAECIFVPQAFSRRAWGD